jgi:hypothetical protein
MPRAAGKSSGDTELLLDTHIALWLDSGDDRLRPSTRALIDECWRSGGTIYLSSVSAWEIALLVHTGRIDLEFPLKRGSSVSSIVPASWRRHWDIMRPLAAISCTVWSIAIQRIVCLFPPQSSLDAPSSLMTSALRASGKGTGGSTGLRSPHDREGCVLINSAVSLGPKSNRNTALPRNDAMCHAMCQKRASCTATKERGCRCLTQ